METARKASAFFVRAAALAATTVAGELAGDGVLLDFERQTPGQPPAGWSVTWKNQGEAVLEVSNLAAAGGRNSFLADLGAGGEKSGGFVYAKTLPKEAIQDSANWALFGFCVMIESKALESELSVRLLPAFSGGHEAALHFSLRGGGPTVHFYPSSKGLNWTENWNAKKLLCEWKPKTWMRFAMAAPLEPSKDAPFAWAMAERLEKGEWKLEGKPQKIAFVPFPRKQMSVSIDFHSKGGVFFFDDISLRGAKELPAEFSSR